MSELAHLETAPEEEDVTTGERVSAWEFLLRWLACAVALSSVLMLVRYLGSSLRIQRLAANDPWIVVGTVLAGALAAAAWTRLVHRTAPQRIHFVLQYVARLTFAPILFSYGVSKVYGGQFYPSFLSTLDSTVSEMSGNALTWAYFGRSYPYTLFVAGAEVLAAFLLLSRRTQLLGGLLTASIFANIAVIDFSYEVGGLAGVKLVSLVGLAAGCSLVAADLGRLRALLGAAVPAHAHPFGARGRTFAIAHLAFLLLWQVPDRTRSYFNVDKFLRSTTPVHGIWDVTVRHVAGTGAHAEMVAAWSRLYFDDQRTFWTEKTEHDVWKRMGGIRGSGPLKSMEYWAAPGNTIEIALPSLVPGDLAASTVFKGTFTLEGDAKVRLEGTVDGQPAQLVLERRELRPTGEDVW